MLLLNLFNKYVLGKSDQNLEKQRQELIDLTKSSNFNAQKWEEDLDKYIKNGGDINSSYKDETMLSNSLRNAEATKILVKKGVDVGRIFVSFMSYSPFINFDGLASILEKSKITEEEKKLLKRYFSEDKKILEAIEKAKIVENKLVEIKVNLTNDKGLCPTLYSLSDKALEGGSGVAFFNTFTDEELKRTEGIAVKGDASAHAKLTYEMQVKALEKSLSNQEDAELVVSSVKKIQKSISECLGIEQERIRYVIRVEASSILPYYFWHKDEGNPATLRVTSTLKGPATMFTSSNEMSSNSPYDEYLVKEFYQPASGQSAAFNAGPKMAVHTAPVTTEPRIYAIFTCEACLTDLTHENLRDKIEHSIAPRAFNETRSLTTLNPPIASISNNTTLEQLTRIDEPSSDRLLPSKINAINPTLNTALTTANLMLNLSKINTAFSTATPESYKGLEEKLTDLQSEFKTRGFNNLAKNSETILESLKEFNKNDPKLDKKARKAEALEIFAAFQKLENVVTVIQNKNISNTHQR